MQFISLSGLIIYLSDFEQSYKNSFRRNSVTYGTPCRAIGHFVFFIITMLLTGPHAVPVAI